jgi:hypothetical protein
MYVPDISHAIENKFPNPDTSSLDNLTEDFSFC